jgi:enoyl-[acyl-carrier protein] reductase/trans-2-enoyl-CoA reductase (NAD+)
MVRSNICLNAHPEGCAKIVRNEIALAEKTLGEKDAAGMPRLVLVVGCSTGYGLASRIAAAFGCRAATVGVSLEKAATAGKTGTPGWYNNRAFGTEAARAGLPAKTIDGDAFSDAVKAETAAAVREIAAAANISAKIDLVIYSLASPVRTDPIDGVTYRSVIKPIGGAYSGKTVDMFTGEIRESGAEPATDAEISATVKVMGGEDWERWMDALEQEGLLADDARTVAYTYIGPELSWAIYKNGTIGRAKEDLERAAKAINSKYAANGYAARRAWVSVNKAVVTRASAVIPVIPFYISVLFRVMKEKGIHEGCIEQIIRLYRDRLYRTGSGLGNTDPAAVPVDGEGRIRIDDLEMRDDVQREVEKRMKEATAENIFSISDIEGFRHDFLEAHGFDVAGIDYGADIDPQAV